MRPCVAMIAYVAAVGGAYGCRERGQAEIAEAREAPSTRGPMDVTVHKVLVDMDGRQTALNPSVYRVDAQKQTVIYWTPEVDEAPRSLASCVVRDANNWRCAFPDGNGTLEMHVGTLRNNPPDGPAFDHVRRAEEKMRQVSRDEWERAKSHR